MESNLKYNNCIWVSSFGLPDIIFQDEEDLQPNAKKPRLADEEGNFHVNHFEDKSSQPSIHSSDFNMQLFKLNILV